jgi:hypothetical protein
MSDMNQIINNIVNEANAKANAKAKAKANAKAKAKAKATSVPPRNLTTTDWLYISSDSEDEEVTGAKATWKQRMLDLYGPVDGPDRISRTPVINMKELQE